MLSPEELMKPRYKVIAGFPRSSYILGEIVHHGQTGKETQIRYTDYPHLFQPLEWWEERTIEQLVSIKYVKVTKQVWYWLVGDVVPVTLEYKTGQPLKFILEYGKIHPVECVVPATQSDYELFKQQKEK